MKLLRFLIFALGLLLGVRVYGAAMATLTNFNAVDFVVNATPTATPTNVIKINHDTFTATNIYVTNLFVTYEVVSNIISGNIQGTPPHLAFFWPDNFSITDSIVTQDADTNGITVNGVGDGSVTLGGANPVVMLQEGGALSVDAFGLLVGTNTFGEFGASGGGAFASFRDTSKGEDNYNGISIYTGGSTQGQMDLTVRTNLADFSVTFNTTAGGPNFRVADAHADSADAYFRIQDSILDPGNTYNYLNLEPFDGGLVPFYMSSAYTVGAGTNLMEVANNKTNLFGLTYDGKIQVGGSATNTLYRSNTDLCYDIGGTNYFQLNLATGIPALVVTNGIGKGAFFGLNAGGNAYIESGTSAIYLGDTLVTQHVQPGGNGTQDIGNGGTAPYRDMYQKGKHVLEGANDGVGNYIWLESYVSNNVVILDFKNGGTGPTPTSFSFRINGAEQSHIP